MDYTVVFYQDENGCSQPLDYLKSLNRKHEAKAKKWLTLLQEYGPNLPRPYADVLERNVRELRPAIEHHQHRFLYVICGKTILITNAFLKKTQVAPKSEIERSKRTFANWLRRKGD
ncbi:MAG: type II toxin-antitoxin system RelE/ParE family toxin [Elusimicrobia bacterium]|nr:type II toxin-antitoxin system RelE/ParE family toxin [Elusimicrobiota bacterium]